MDIEVIQDVTHTTYEGEEVVGDASATHIENFIVQNMVWVKDGVVWYETIVYDSNMDKVVLRTGSQILQEYP